MVVNAGFGGGRAFLAPSLGARSALIRFNAGRQATLEPSSQHYQIAQQTAPLHAGVIGGGRAGGINPAYARAGGAPGALADTVTSSITEPVKSAVQIVNEGVNRSPLGLLGNDLVARGVGNAAALANQYLDTAPGKNSAAFGKMVRSEASGRVTPMDFAQAAGLIPDAGAAIDVGVRAGAYATPRTLMLAREAAANPAVHEALSRAVGASAQGGAREAVMSAAGSLASHIMGINKGIKSVSAAIHSNEGDIPDIFSMEYNPRQEPPVSETKDILPPETPPPHMDPALTAQNEAIAKLRDDSAMIARQQAQDARKGIVRDKYGRVTGKTKPNPEAASSDYLPLNHPARKLANDEKFATVEIDSEGRIHSVTSSGYYDLTGVKKQALATLRQGALRQKAAGLNVDELPKGIHDIPDEWAQGVLDTYKGPHYVVDKYGRKMIAEGLTLDHGEALANGGKNTLDNLFPMLGKDNFSKGKR